MDDLGIARPTSIVGMSMSVGTVSILRPDFNPQTAIGARLNWQSPSPPTDRSTPKHLLQTHANLLLEVTDSPTFPSAGRQCQTRVGDTHVRQYCPPDGKIYPQLTKKSWKINLVQSLKRSIGWGTWIPS